MFTIIMAHLHDMPGAMRRLAVVQFFSWFSRSSLRGIYTTAAVTSVHYGTADAQSALYNDGAEAERASYSLLTTVLQRSLRS